VPSQPQPDHLQDTLRYAPRPALRLDEEDEDERSWDRALRPVASDSPVAHRFGHSRDSSAEKISQTHQPLASPRLYGPHSRSPLGGVVERIIDPKSATYGHHRQTSIVHGYQHSRNGSLASTSSSPLSPQMIAAAGVGLDRPDMQSVAIRIDGDSGYPSRPPTSLSGNVATMDRPNAADAPYGQTQRKPERMHSKSRRDHTPHHSHSSRHHKDEQKTVGEYALHVLFTSVSEALIQSMCAPLTLIVYCTSRRKADGMCDCSSRPRTKR
jgi:hypothetical protein